MRPVLRWIARSNTPEIFTATSLLLVVAIAALMQVVGLSMALGAFLAGVLLAESEYRHELETDIEPFKGLLLGLFFIAVGMSIDFGVLLRAARADGAGGGRLPGDQVGVIYALAKAMDMPYQQRPVFTLLLAQGGEFAFVVFQARRARTCCRMASASFLIGAVALSMLISPLLLVAIDKWVLPRYERRRARRRWRRSPSSRTPRCVICGFGRYGQIIGRLLTRARPADRRCSTTTPTRSRACASSASACSTATRRGSTCCAPPAPARPRCWWWRSTTWSSRWRSSTWCASTSRRPRSSRARATSAHYYQLRDRKVELIEREVFESSLRSARSVLEVLGWPAHEAREAAMRFRQRNIGSAEDATRTTRTAPSSSRSAKEGRQQFEEQMARERGRSGASAAAPDWDRGAEVEAERPACCNAPGA